MTPDAPADVVRSLLDDVTRLMAGDDTQVERLAARYAEQTWVTHPMALGAVAPLRTRDDLRRHFARARETVGPVDGWEVADLVVHRTTDPEVVIAESRYVVTRGASTHDVPTVFVVRVRDGLVVESHDYAAHHALG